MLLRRGKTEKRDREREKTDSLKETDGYKTPRERVTDREKTEKNVIITKKVFTLLALSIIHSQSKQWRPLTPHEIHLPRLQVELEDGPVHVIRPEHVVQMVSDPEWVVDFFTIIHHLNTDRVFQVSSVSPILARHN